MDKKRVLIIEDEFITALALKKILVRNGYQICDIVKSGSEAIMHALNERPDLMVMDIFLDDDVTGIEVVETIHARTFIPVLYVTASTDESVMKKIHNTNMIGVLQKPFKMQDFQETILKIQPYN